MSPTTIARLRGLKPGESCLWYRGNLVTDIKRSAETVPAYAQLLADLHAEVLALEERGFVKLTTRKAGRDVPPQHDGDKPQRVGFVEYTAVRGRP